MNGNRRLAAACLASDDELMLEFVSGETAHVELIAPGITLERALDHTALRIRFSRICETWRTNFSVFSADQHGPGGNEIFLLSVGVSQVTRPLFVPWPPRPASPDSPRPHESSRGEHGGRMLVVKFSLSGDELTLEFRSGDTASSEALAPGVTLERAADGTAMHLRLTGLRESWRTNVGLFPMIKRGDKELGPVRSPHGNLVYPLSIGGTEAHRPVYVGSTTEAPMAPDFGNST